MARCPRLLQFGDSTRKSPVENFLSGDSHTLTAYVSRKCSPNTTTPYKEVTKKELDFYTDVESSLDKRRSEGLVKFNFDTTLPFQEGLGPDFCTHFVPLSSCELCSSLPAASIASVSEPCKATLDGGNKLNTAVIGFSAEIQNSSSPWA